MQATFTIVVLGNCNQMQSVVQSVVVCSQYRQFCPQNFCALDFTLNFSHERWCPAGMCPLIDDDDEDDFDDFGIEIDDEQQDGDYEPESEELEPIEVDID